MLAESGLNHIKSKKTGKHLEEIVQKYRLIFSIK